MIEITRAQYEELQRRETYSFRRRLERWLFENRTKITASRVDDKQCSEIAHASLDRCLRAKILLETDIAAVAVRWLKNGGLKPFEEEILFASRITPDDRVATLRLREAETLAAQGEARS